MMKTASAPRRIYVRKATAHVCFDGRVYGLGKDNTDIDIKLPVTIEKLRSWGDHHRVQVSQQVDGKTITEIWREVKF